MKHFVRHVIHTINTRILLCETHCKACSSHHQYKAPLFETSCKVYNRHHYYKGWIVQFKISEIHISEDFYHNITQKEGFNDVNNLSPLPPHPRSVANIHSELK
jgi:hypothetical protein